MTQTDVYRASNPRQLDLGIATENTKRDTTSGLCESEDERLAHGRFLRRRPPTNKDNEKDNDTKPSAQISKRPNQVQGEPSKTDPGKVTCPVCKKDFKHRGLPIHQAKSGCKEKLQQQVQHRIRSKSEASNIQETNHSGIESRVNLKEKEESMVAQSPKCITEQAKQEPEEKTSTPSNWLQNRKEEETKDSQSPHIERKRTEKENESKSEPLQKEVSRSTKKTEDENQETEKGRMNNKEDGKNKDLQSPGVEGKITGKEDECKAELMAQKEKAMANKKKEQTEREKKQTSMSNWLLGRSDRETTESHPPQYKEKLTTKASEMKSEFAQKEEKKSNQRKKKICREKKGQNGNILAWIKSQENLEKQTPGEKKHEENTLSEGFLAERQKSILIGPPDEILVKHQLQMTRSDFRSLFDKNYLNDKIIDQYLMLIKIRNEKDPKLPTISIQSVYFHQKLDQLGVEQGMEDTKKWIRDDIMEKEVFLIPIHKRDHWSLVGVDIKTRTIHYFDSIKGSRETAKAPGIIKTYLERYCKNKGNTETFKIKRRQDVPLQTNGVDCGVFVCQYAERFARKAPMNFSQEDMAVTRMKISHEIFSGRIIQNCPTHIRKLVKKTKEERSQKKESKTRKKKKEKKQKPGGEKENVDHQKERIQWPKANSAEWQRLDEDAHELLKLLYAPPEKKAMSHPTIIYSMAKERFGVKKERERETTSGPSRRQKKCSKLRSEIKSLKKAVEEAPIGEKRAIIQLQKEKLRSLRLAKRAESMKKHRKKFSKNCKDFLSQPFDFTRNVISPKPKGNLESNKDEVEGFLRKAHSDPCKEREREPQEDLWTYEEPKVEFNNSPPSFNEFMKRLRKTRAKSAPGPNGVPYIVYKRCPKVARQLWLYLKGMWKKNAISENWRTAEGILIPKIDGASQVDNFRTISLLNVEGKIYFAMRADRLLKFVQDNKYIDSSIQKGGLPEISGCLEHTAILSQLIREAKAEKKNLVITWLDVANAYGSIPHSLIQTALQRAHVPEDMCNLVKDYYSTARIRFTTNKFTTEWQQVEKGIITGCTLSVILFALTMTMLVMSVKNETKGPKTTSGQQQECCRLFMDDIATSTETTVQTRHLLNKLIDKLKWANLMVKPEKCRTMVIKRGKISTQTMQIESKAITSITEKPIRYLGKTYNMTLNEKQQTEDTIKQAKEDLRKIDKCKVPGRYKGWMMQHMLLPRLLWPLSIYNIPTTKVEVIQRLMTNALKRWLGLPKSLSIDCLFSKSSKLQLPYTALTEEVKVAKVRNKITLDESTDACTSNAGIVVDGGTKANTAEEIDAAKSRLRMRDIVGVPNRGREGLGLTKVQYYHSSTKKEQRAMVTGTVREMEEEKRKHKMVQLAKQGACTRWEVPAKQLSHKDILETSTTSLKFLVKAVYDLLPTPVNKNAWFGTDEKCLLCGEDSNLNHVLASCKVALSQGRYRWRHDQVLGEIAKLTAEKVLNSQSRPQTQQKLINFVRTGSNAKVVQSKSGAGSYFDGAEDWNLQVDLNKHVKIPRAILQTNLRPDLVVMSEKKKLLGMMELTVPYEDRIEMSCEIKRNKYKDIVVAGERKGWKVMLWTVEVGCRGFPAASLGNYLRDIGFSGTERSKQLRRIGEIAQSASNEIWKWSHFRSWGRYGGK